MDRFTGVKFSYKGNKYEAAVDETAVIASDFNGKHLDAVVFRASSDADWQYVIAYRDCYDPLFLNALHKVTEELAPVDIHEEDGIDWVSIG